MGAFCECLTQTVAFSRVNAWRFQRFYPAWPPENRRERRRALAKNSHPLSLKHSQDISMINCGDAELKSHGKAITVAKRLLAQRTLSRKGRL